MELVEGGHALPFTQSAEGLTLQMSAPVATQGIHDKNLAQGYKVIRITHDKAWFNDDDPGVRTFGWDRQCKTHEEDFNNDLSFSTQVGDTWTVNIDQSRGFTIVAPQGMCEGVMEVRIDGKHAGEVKFVKEQDVKHQSVVFTSKKLRKTSHEIQLVNKSGMIALDAIIVR